MSQTHHVRDLCDACHVGELDRHSEFLNNIKGRVIEVLFRRIEMVDALCMAPDAACSAHTCASATRRDGAGNCCPSSHYGGSYDRCCGILHDEPASREPGGCPMQARAPTTRICRPSFSLRCCKPSAAAAASPRRCCKHELTFFIVWFFCLCCCGRF